MDASRGTPISFTLPELFNALGGFRACSIEHRREPFFPPELRSYIPPACLVMGIVYVEVIFFKRKIKQQNEKRAKDGYSWVHECCDPPKQIHSIHMSKCYEKSLQTWGLVSHYNIFHQPLGIIQPILIRGKTLFFVAYFLLVLDKTTCFFPILGSPKSSKKEGHGGS